MSSLEKLKKLRAVAGKPRTTGLADAVIEKFLKKDPLLGAAIDAAWVEFEALQRDFGDLLKKDEAVIIETLQADFLNFYAHDAINPYVPLAAQGPWVVTCKGAVIHDSGGYGMLGFGHGPAMILPALRHANIMANIMTANFSQARLVRRLRQELGCRNQKEKNPYAKFVCLNSGSEAITFATRLSDINAKNLTDPGARHAGKKIKFLSMKQSFHGRTDRPAQISDSSLPAYRKHLASYQGRDNLATVALNDVDGLRQAFAAAERAGVFFEAVFIEPVMGEGNPGEGVTPAFYNAARELTNATQTLMVVDSIQAGLRAQGCLSILDYPGFENCAAPDIEVYSKALNAGQFPLSVVAMSAPVAAMYKTGIYGNTMTTNPRALEVACAVLDAVTPELRRNIQERGKEMVSKLDALKNRFPGVVEGAKGTGLLCSLAINPAKIKVVGVGALEEKMRLKGIGVIHGGANSLRFTPHFRLTSEEIDLIVNTLADVLEKSA